MTNEISRGDLLEYPRNAAGDTLTERWLKFFTDIATFDASTPTLSRDVPADFVGKLIEFKHPTDYTKYEMRTVTAISGAVVTLDSPLINTYPAASPVFEVIGERDMIDSLIVDRTEASVLMMEKEFREAD